MVSKKNLRRDKMKLRAWAFLAGFMAIGCIYPPVFAQETITITTYYPSPYGVYSNLRTDYLGVGSTYRSTSLSDGQAVFVGNVAIGTTTLTYALNVNGDINVTGDYRQNGSVYPPPDYVFAPSYALMSFPELRKFLAENRHLPNFPSAEEMKAQGIKLVQMNMQLLEKLEEAYLYILQLEERISKLEQAKTSP